ncbi:circularly permuted type 2 ATP-grasp protein [Polynucleobacter rarus]|uniref:circularly permuted type 2 ATP-grasp protein n=1 Tax=Polynucleobacter rarus TaxID=556055 RepID=UPI000D3E197F|nr:circularly permuted type 2 ATP-grasp protein [Polynucleobacter rarus]
MSQSQSQSSFFKELTTQQQSSNEQYESVSKADATHYDELYDSEQPGSPTMRAHWRDFFGYLQPKGLSDFNARTKEIERQVRDNGITYNIYVDENGPQRPWTIDLFPLIIPHEEWLVIQAGIMQRAQLLEAMMQDVYGPGNLIKEGLIPPALVNGHPGYLRAMHQAIPKDKKHLHIMAFDLARGPNGNWSVLSQRTQAPSGLGYLLENRNLVSKQFPKAYEQMRIESLTRVYRGLVQSLKRESKAGQNAHIVLLTPGPYNETYFEHAYLARYLGLTLVEGNDLTVRNQCAYLRTIHGLEPVHVIIKRLDDTFLDPLELKEDSTLGVPGLMQVIRAGNVVIANAPGSGFLESPGLLAFLPSISERLLGQPLLLPAVDTWWCGEDAAFESAKENLVNSAVKATYPSLEGHQHFDSFLVKNLGAKESSKLLEKIKKSPDDFTIQSYLPLAQIPTWQADSNPDLEKCIEPRSYMLRVFAMSDGIGNSWQILPGGLARIAADPDGVASMQRGGSSTDVWVQGQSYTQLPILFPSKATSVGKAHRDRVITSRSAENLYWFGRYTERSENTIALATMYLESLNSENSQSDLLWNWLDKSCQMNGLMPFSQAVMPTTSEEMEPRDERMLLSQLNSSTLMSVGFNLRAVQSAASKVRESLSTDLWSMINRCVERFENDCQLMKVGNDYSITLALQSLSTANQFLSAITGAQNDRMTRDAGWTLMNIGRLIERLQFFSSILESAIEEGVLSNPFNDTSGFNTLLGLFDSTITFQAQHQQSRDLNELLELLVFNTENPRSIAWISRKLRNRLAKLTNSETRVENSHVDVLVHLVPHVKEVAFEDLLDCVKDCIRQAWTISDEITGRYFTHIKNSAYKIQR